MLDSLNSDYVRTARAKGLRRQQAVIRHALRMSLIPTSTYFAFSIATLFVGAAFMEILFNEVWAIMPSPPYLAMMCMVL